MSCQVEGHPDSPILIVGMAPGREELAQGRPFVGGSGRLLWALAKRAGFSRTDCFIVNVIGEWPAKANGNPSQEQLERYWDVFDKAINSSSCRVALCLGGSAFDRLTGIVSAERRAKRRSGIESWRGYLVTPTDCQGQERKVVTYGQYKTTTKLHKKGDPKVIKHKVVLAPNLPSGLEWIIPTLHPAAVLRTGYKSIPALAADIDRVARAWRGQLRQPDTSYVEHPLVGEAGDLVAVDIETNWEAGMDGAINRVGSSSSRGTWTRPWDYLAKIGVESETANPLKTIVMHNAPFDMPRLEAEGVQFNGPLWDTMLCAATLQPDLPKALNSVASLVLDVPRWKHLSSADPAFYNAMDVAYTRQIALYQQDELKRTGQYDWFTKAVMPAVPTLIAMTKRGIRVDVERRARWLEELSVDETEREARWRILTGGVHPSSPKQVAEYLYDTLGLPDQYGSTGGRTADVNAIKELLGYVRARGDREHDHSVVVLESLLGYRTVSKLRSTYAERGLAGDGCIHPSYLPASKDEEGIDGKGLAGTGRITSRDPNIQNQPLEARKLFIPHSSDLILVEADYSQIELRIAAALSKDGALQEALKGDVHGRTMELLGCDRVRAKNVMYGTLYGAGPRKLSKVLRAKGFALTEHEARNLQDALARAYPALWAWRQAVVEEVGKVYYLSTPFGQRRYFWQGRREAPAAIDFLPQGTAAGIMWQILPALDSALTNVGGTLLTTVHDSILCETHRDKVAETVDAIRGCMEREWGAIAPAFMVPTDVKMGENWGEMEEWKA